MQDNIQVFCRLAKEQGLDIDLARPLNQSSTGDEEMMLKDRELIADFLTHT